VKLNFGESWYLRFGTTDDLDVFKVRISDHGVRLKSNFLIVITFTLNLKILLILYLKKLMSYINPASPIYEVVEKTDIVEGATIQRAIYPKIPTMLSLK